VFILQLTSASGVRGRVDLCILRDGDRMTDNSICEECGKKMDPERDKDNRGWWRRACKPCIRELSPEERE